MRAATAVHVLQDFFMLCGQLKQQKQANLQMSGKSVEHDAFPAVDSGNLVYSLRFKIHVERPMVSQRNHLRIDAEAVDVAVDARQTARMLRVRCAIRITITTKFSIAPPTEWTGALNNKRTMTISECKTNLTNIKRR